MKKKRILAQSSGLYVSKVVHKAYNETSKNGTKDAAATGIKEVECCLNEPIDLTVDRPFLFMILYINQTLFIESFILR